MSRSFGTGTIAGGTGQFCCATATIVASKKTIGIKTLRAVARRRELADGDRLVTVERNENDDGWSVTSFCESTWRALRLKSWHAADELKRAQASPPWGGN